MKISEIKNLAEAVELKGTEKQIAWSNQIRAEYIQNIQGEGRFLGKVMNEQSLLSGKSVEEQTEMVLSLALKVVTETSAAWWIESRDNLAENAIVRERSNGWELFIQNA